MPIIKGKSPLTTAETLAFHTSKKNRYYLIKISARAQSEKQRGTTDDEDITVKIDNTEFSKSNTQNGLINSPASFNGGKLHNKEQIIYFIIHLKTGKHGLMEKKCG